MLKILDPTEFKELKREKLLDYALYSNESTDVAARIARVGERMTDKEWMSKKTAAEVMRMTHARAEYAADFLTLSYSAGIPVTELKIFYPDVLNYWEAYAKYAKAFDDSPEYQGSEVAHFGLLGGDFEMVNRIACFGVLLGWTKFLPRLASLLDYRNPKMDGMLERMFRPFVTGRPTPPDECTRHLPYFKTLKIFRADRKDQASMMARYLEEWYYASRREPYYDSHKGGTSFKGYWSWEAAAITFLLDIDDSSYRDATFYPADLVEFARAQRNSSLSNGLAADAAGELRARSGDACPRRGLWESLTDPVVRRIFEQGNVMSNLHASYGLTVWIYKGDA
ncbi:PoNe immunity protein domain-containing protein [Massilia sp. S19_KUP03_FR1]|uniref:PoNe immunity protein domain-containing protein n=1 Tax=Massilia sp. S19_KUP03_FR1 TaxID=3025503 RepID=UPI002FCD7D90